MKIRKATERDIKTISRLIRNTILKVNSIHYQKKQMDFELSCFTPEKIKIYLKKKIIFCLSEEENILGVIMLNLKDKTIEALFLKPKFIGKGFGKRLLIFAEDYVIKRGIKEITLYPTEYALEFYKKAGYKIRRKFKGTQNGGFPVIEMKKKLK